MIGSITFPFLPDGFARFSSCNFSMNLQLMITPRTPITTEQKKSSNVVQMDMGGSVYASYIHLQTMSGILCLDTGLTLFVIHRYIEIITFQASIMLHNKGRFTNRMLLRNVHRILCSMIKQLCIKVFDAMLIKPHFLSNLISNQIIFRFFSA